MVNPFEELEKLKAAVHQGEVVLEVLNKLREVQVEGKNVDTLAYCIAAITRIGAHVAALREEFAQLEKVAGAEFAEIKQALEKDAQK